MSGNKIGERTLAYGIIGVALLANNLAKIFFGLLAVLIAVLAIQHPKDAMNAARAVGVILAGIAGIAVLLVVLGWMAAKMGYMPLKEDLLNNDE